MTRDEFNALLLGEPFSLKPKGASIQATSVFGKRKELSWQELYNIYRQKNQSHIKKKMMDYCIEQGAIPIITNRETEVDMVKFNAILRGENIEQYSHLTGSDWEKIVQIAMLEGRSRKMAENIAQRATVDGKVKPSSKYAKYI